MNTAARVVPLRASPSVDDARAAFDRHIGRSTLAAHTRTAYRNQVRYYCDWLAMRGGEHPDAFADDVGAAAAAMAWRRDLLEQRKSPATVNQALAAVALLYEAGAGIRIRVKRARVPRPGAPVALTAAERGMVERVSVRRGARDAAIIAVLLYAGARAEECQRLRVKDVMITARTGTVRLHGKGDQVRVVPLPAVARERIAGWLRVQGPGEGPLWMGIRGPLMMKGIAYVVRQVGATAGIPRLHPHQLRHTYATALRQGGVDPEQIRVLLGHASLETTARYFRAGTAEVAAAVGRVFDGPTA